LKNDVDSSTSLNFIEFIGNEITSPNGNIIRISYSRSFPIDKKHVDLRLSNGDMNDIDRFHNKRNDEKDFQ